MCKQNGSGRMRSMVCSVAFEKPMGKDASTFLVQSKTFERHKVCICWHAFQNSASENYSHRRQSNGVQKSRDEHVVMDNFYRCTL